MPQDNMETADLVEILKKKPELNDFIGKVLANTGIIPMLLEIMETYKGSVKFYCEKIIRLIGEKNPEVLYPYFDNIANLLDSSNNFIKWGAIITIANLAAADSENKLAGIYEKYFSLINSESVITAGNVVGNAWKIVLKDPGLEEDITERLLGVEKNIYLNKGRPSPECKNIMFGHILDCFDKYYQQAGDKEKIIRFAAGQTNNPRKTVVKKAEAFLKKNKLDSKLEITRLSRASWFKIKYQHTVLHFDPGYTGYFENQRIPLAELADKADLILVSHCHKDHLQPLALEKIAAEKTIVFVPESTNTSGSIGYRTISLNKGAEAEACGIKIEAFPAYNTDEGRSTKKFHNKNNSVGYVIQIAQKRIYFAGDTDFIPEMKDLKDIDIAFLPIGGTYVMNIEEAVKAVLAFQPKVVIPMHQAKNNLERFKQEAYFRSGAEVKILKVGDKVSI
jgi:L-ascorbate metabolism protein UlaG (beta-lactamase superfamily)